MPTNDNEAAETVSAEDYAEAVRIVWRLLEVEAGLAAGSIRVGIDMRKLLKQDTTLKGRLLRGVESATGTKFMDGLWQYRYFTMADFIDCCARLVNRKRGND